jgi:predicted DNA-binding protein with PD1-like motif
MHVMQTPSGYLVRLDRGEEVVESLSRFAREQGLPGGAMTGIGAVKNTTIGFFDLEQKEYNKREFPQEMELVGLTGNMAWADGEPVIHAHVMLSGPDYAAYGGHLFSAEIAVTGEIFVSPTEIQIQRSLDPETGLKLIAGGGSP